MNQDDLKALAERQRSRGRRIAKAGTVARPAVAAEPAKPGPVPPEKPSLRIVAGGKLGRDLRDRQTAPATAPARRMKVPDEVLARAKARGRKEPTEQPFSAYKPAPGVLPPNRKLAQDSALPGVQWANGAFLEGALFEGMEFLGYPYLAYLLQRTEYRRACERLSTEMTRKWIDLTSTGDDDKTEKIKELDVHLKELKLQEVMNKAAFMDLGFGRSHVYVDTGDTDDPRELKTPIGDGRNKFTRSKVKKGSLRRFQVVEPVWCYPARYNANNPLRGDWYKPETWFAMGSEVHHTRLIPFVGREVPDLLKPSYGFGGLALTQMLKPYVDNWLDTRQSISRLIGRFSTSGIKTDMQQQLSPDPSGVSAGGGMSNEDFFKRFDLFVTMAKNEGLLVLDKGSEEFFQNNVPLGTLDALQAQSQEQMCSASGIPVVVLLGLTPHGLNACLTADTLIETDHGHIPIKDVLPGQKVMTREGWAPVAKAGCTAYATELVEITASGSTLRCTPEHKIWLPSINGFVPAENVRPGDVLICRGVTENNGTGSQSSTEAYFGGIAGTATTRPPDHTKEKVFFTGRSGASTMGLFHKAITSITSIKIAETIRSATLSFSAPATMRESMALPTGSSFASLSASSGSVGTAESASWWGNQLELSSVATGADSPNGEARGYHKLSRALYAIAPSAGRLLKRSGETPNTALESALPRVKTDQRTQQTIIGTIRTNGLRGATSAIEGVVSNVRRAPASEFVYDIQVASGFLPEFFANGMCVHNSSEGEIRAFEDWVGAYQKHFYGDKLQRLIDFAMVDLWGDVDPEIGYKWVPLHSLDEKGAADVQKTKADTDGVYVDRGVLDPLEVRRKIAADPESGYNGIDVEDVPEPPEEEGAGGDDPDNDPFGGGEQNDNEPADGKNSKLKKFAGDDAKPNKDTKGKD